MTRKRIIPQTAGEPRRDDDQVRLRQAIAAVCDELGLSTERTARRRAVEARMQAAFRTGPRHNLNLVDAGLRA